MNILLTLSHLTYHPSWQFNPVLNVNDVQRKNCQTHNSIVTSLLKQREYVKMQLCCLPYIRSNVQHKTFSPFCAANAERERECAMRARRTSNQCRRFRFNCARFLGNWFGMSGVKRTNAYVQCQIIVQTCMFLSDASTLSVLFSVHRDNKNESLKKKERDICTRNQIRRQQQQWNGKGRRKQTTTECFW